MKSATSRERPERADERGCRLTTDRRAAADRQDQHVDVPDRLLLRASQLGLAEVAEVSDAQPVERETEDRVRTALRPGCVVVLRCDERG